MTPHPLSYQLDAHAVGHSDATLREHLAKCDACTQYVQRVTLECAAIPLPKPAAAPRSRGGFAYLPPLAALASAALLTLWMRPHEEPRSAGGAEVSSFKGASIGVVLLRSGVQSRHTGTVHVAPGDALRVEFTLEQEQDVAAAFSGNDGSWVPLQPPQHMSRGTHFSERSLRFDATPTPGQLLFGSPDDLERARVRRGHEGLVQIQLVVDP